MKDGKTKYLIPQEDIWLNMSSLSLESANVLLRKEQSYKIKSMSDKGYEVMWGSFILCLNKEKLEQYNYIITEKNNTNED